LQGISIISLKDTKLARNTELDFDALSGDQELALLLLKKTIALLEKSKELEHLFNETILFQEADAIVVESMAIPSHLELFRSLLLNLKVAELGDDESKEYYIQDYFKDFFRAQISGRYSTHVSKNSNTLKGTKCFVSYASPDEEYKNALKNHLQGLINSGYIEYWDGQIIPPGAEWDKEIKNRLNEAEVIIFLVSADSISSAYINNVEFALAMQKLDRKEAIILPVMVRNCDVESSPFNRFMRLPTKDKAISSWKNRDAAYVNVVKGLKNILNIKPAYEKNELGK